MLKLPALRAASVGASVLLLAVDLTYALMIGDPLRVHFCVVASQVQVIANGSI